VPNQTAQQETTITRQKLIERLNEDLAREYQAVIAYVVYSQVLKGAEYMSIAKELEKHAGEELSHALKISKHIDYLGGMPTATPLAVVQSEDARMMLRADLDNENNTIRAYRQRVRGGHPRDSAPGAGTPDRSGDGAGRESAGCLPLVGRRRRSLEEAFHRRRQRADAQIRRIHGEHPRDPAPVGVRIGFPAAAARILAAVPLGFARSAIGNRKRCVGHGSRRNATRTPDGHAHRRSIFHARDASRVSDHDVTG